jgi:hypothetical protein
MVDAIQRMANYAVSHYGNNEWLSQLLRTRRLWSAKCEALCEKLGLTLNRLPSDTTFRRVLQKLDFALLAQQFEQWAS